MPVVIKPCLITKPWCFDRGTGLDNKVSRTDIIRSVCEAEGVTLQKFQKDMFCKIYL